MGNTISFNTNRMSSIVIPSGKDPKQKIREQAIAKVKQYLSKATSVNDLAKKKQVLRTILKCYQNAVNNEGQYQYVLGDSSIDIGNRRQIPEFFGITESDLEILCCHQNSFFTDRKLNFFGEACYTNSIQSIMDEINAHSHNSGVSPATREFNMDNISSAPSSKLEQGIDLEKRNVRDLLLKYNNSSSSIKDLDPGTSYHQELSAEIQQIERILNAKEVSSFLSDGSLGELLTTENLTNMLSHVNKFIENCSNDSLIDKMQKIVQEINTQLEAVGKANYSYLGEVYERKINEDDLNSFLPAIENYRMAGNAAKVQELELRAIACDKAQRPDVYANLAKFERILGETFDKDDLGIFKDKIIEFYFGQLKIGQEYNIYHDSFELGDLKGSLCRLLFAKLVCGQLKFNDDLGFELLAKLLIIEFDICENHIEKDRGSRISKLNELVKLIDPELNNKDSRELTIFGMPYNTILSFEYRMQDFFYSKIGFKNTKIGAKSGCFLKGINQYPTGLDTANQAISNPHVMSYSSASNRYNDIKSDLPKLFTLYLDMLLGFSENKKSEQHVKDLFTQILQKINDLIPNYKYDGSLSQWQEIFSNQKYMGLIVSDNEPFAKLMARYLESETDPTKKAKFYSQVAKAYSAAAETETDPTKKADLQQIVRKNINIAEKSFENALKTISDQAERINAYKEYIGLFETAGFTPLLQNLPTSYASELVLARRFDDLQNYLTENSVKNKELKEKYVDIIDSDATKDGYSRIAINWFFMRGMFDQALQCADFISNGQEKDLYKTMIGIFTKIGWTSQGRNDADKIKDTLVSLMKPALNQYSGLKNEFEALKNLQNNPIALTGGLMVFLLYNLIEAYNIICQEMAPSVT